MSKKPSPKTFTGAKRSSNKGLFQSVKVKPSQGGKADTGVLAKALHVAKKKTASGW